MAEMSEATRTVLEQGFVTSHETWLHASARAAAGNDNVAEQSRLFYLRNLEQMGMREAAAANRLNGNELASAILSQRSASGQPQAKPA